jgi:3-phosphoshikimate 1-carboxyvinyltransferase
MPLPSAATVVPARSIRGRLTVPGDKSISHRYAILGAVAEGRSSLDNFAPGADCRSTLVCLERLGVEIATGPNGTITLLGRGLGRLSSPSGPLDAGNSGTTMRLLAGILAGHRFSAQIVGDASLSRRPMRRVIGPLERMGARIESAEGHAPLTIHGAALHGVEHRPDVPSAQVKSAVLLAGLLAEGTTTVNEPAQTRDHTERALATFGVCLVAEGRGVSVSGGQRLAGQTLDIPGDFSSAAVWMVAAALLPGSRIEIDDVGLNPTRTALLSVLQRFGARVSVHVAAREADEPRGRLVVEGDRRRPVEISPEEVPGLIDELPAVAALAAHGGEVSVRGATELRVKESDRIAELVAGFRALGIDADERPDGFVVSGPSTGSGTRSSRPSGGTADAHGDHRLVMAFALAGLAAGAPSTILGADAVDISYPGFFQTLERLIA